MAKYKYPVVCLAHKCPGHSYKGSLQYYLHKVGKLLPELHPALKMHPHGHHRDLALLAPHGPATEPPHSVAPKTELNVWFHTLLPKTPQPHPPLPHAPGPHAPQPHTPQLHTP